MRNKTFERLCIAMVVLTVIMSFATCMASPAVAGDLRDVSYSPFSHMISAVKPDSDALFESAHLPGYRITRDYRAELFLENQQFDTNISIVLLTILMLWMTLGREFFKKRYTSRKKFYRLLI